MSDLQQWLDKMRDCIRRDFPFKPHLILSPNGNAASVFTEDVGCHSVTISGEGADIALFHALSDNRVVGCRLAWYPDDPSRYLKEPLSFYDEDHGRFEVLLSDDSYTGQWIPGEPGDCALYRSQKTGKIIGCLLAVRSARPNKATNNESS